MPRALYPRLAGVIGAGEVDARLAAQVRAAIPERFAPESGLPDRAALTGKLQAIFEERGASLAEVALVGVSLPRSAAVLPQRLSQQLRRRDFVAWLPSNTYVLLVLDVLEEDIPGVRRRFTEAIAAAAGCEPSELAVRVTLAAVPHKTTQDIIRSLLAGVGP